MYSNPMRNIKLSNGSPVTGAKNTAQKTGAQGLSNNNADKATSKIGFSTNQGPLGQSRQNYYQNSQQSRLAPPKNGGVSRSQEILVKQTSPQVTQKKGEGFPTTRIIFKQKNQLGDHENPINKDQANGRVPVKSSASSGITPSSSKTSNIPTSNSIKFGSTNSRTKPDSRERDYENYDGKSGLPSKLPKIDPDHEKKKKPETLNSINALGSTGSKQNQEQLNSLNDYKQQIKGQKPKSMNYNSDKFDTEGTKESTKNPAGDKEENKNASEIMKRQKRLSDAGSLLANFDAQTFFEQHQKEDEQKKKNKSQSVGESQSIKNTLAEQGNKRMAEESVNEEKIFYNIGFKSKAGAMPGNVTKTNQDSFITHANMGNHPNKSFYAVCDGHGTNGHHVSGFVKQNLPKYLEKFYKETKDDSFNSIKQAMTQAFLSTNKELIDHSNIDCNFSGSTTVSMFQIGKKIFTANVGDSRAILCKYKGGEWKAIPLSEDQKPDDPKEKQRIIAAGGRVEAFKDYSGEVMGPSRVWLKDENIPGLAMSRSIGDLVAAKVGVIPEPEVKEFELSEEDRIIVIASDGVWEFLSNTQVMNYCIPFYNKNQPEGACEKLIKESVICWKREDEVIDDITAIVIFLKVGKN